MRTRKPRVTLEQVSPGALINPLGLRLAHPALSGQKSGTGHHASALWARAKKNISDDEYREFYKHVAHDFEPPLAYTHNRVEGNKEYIQLLYIPSHAPFDLWDREHRRAVVVGPLPDRQLAEAAGAVVVGAAG